jgi:hypothetical protein
LYVEAAKKGKEIPIRPIPAIDAIDEAVSRSAEMGRPVHFTPGYTVGGVYNPAMGPGLLAGLTVLRKVIDSCAKRGARPIVSLAQPEAIPVAEEALKASYAAQNMPVPSDSIRFISTDQLSYAAGVLATLREERPGANILIGFFWKESLLFAEGGATIGALQIAGTSSIGSMPYFMTSCDYALMGEELFVAKAYIERDPPDVGSIAANDFLRGITVGLAFVIWLASNLNLKTIMEILRV